MNFEFYELMVANGFCKQKDLANAAGLAESLISMIMRGHEPSLRTCKKISAVFTIAPISAADLYRKLYENAQIENITK